MQGRSKTRNRVIALALAGLMIGLGGCGGSGPQEFMSLGTAGTGGIYYPLGGALAARLSVLDSLRQYTAGVSGGAVENVNRLRGNQIDLAFATGNTIYEAATGGQDYEGEGIPDLRILAPLYPNQTHILVSEASDATSLADVAGGSISVGAAGSGTEQMSRQILEAYGLSYDDVSPRYLSFSESATALKDGALDAAIISVGYPAAAVLEATTTAGARLLPMGEEQIRYLLETYPYYSRGLIPAGSYPGVEEDVVTAAMLNWVVGKESLPDDVVSLVIRVVSDERATLEQVHDMATQIDMASLEDAPIDVHSATAEWMTSGGSR